MRSRSRVTLRKIESLLPHPRLSCVLHAASEHSGELTLELGFDDPGHVRLTRADDELVDRATAVRDLSGRRVVLVSYDSGARFRARALDLEAVNPAHKEKTDDAGA